MLTSSGLKVSQLGHRFLKAQFASRRWNQVSTSQGKSPVKFTTSEAHVKYKAVRNFYGDDRDLPDSHNYVLAGSGITAIFYLIFLRDDVDNDGGLALLRPLHETMPQYAVPLLKSAIKENKRAGLDTSKLEEKLAEYQSKEQK